MRFNVLWCTVEFFVVHVHIFDPKLQRCRKTRRSGAVVKTDANQTVMSWKALAREIGYCLSMQEVFRLSAPSLGIWGRQASQFSSDRYR